MNFYSNFITFVILKITNKNIKYQDGRVEHIMVSPPIHGLTIKDVLFNSMQPTFPQHIRSLNTTRGDKGKDSFYLSRRTDTFFKNTRVKVEILSFSTQVKVRKYRPEMHSKKE